MKPGVTKILDRAAQLAKNIDVLVGTRVMVGVPEDKSARKEGQITNAALAYIFEHGSPEINMPARPSLSTGIERARGDTVAALRKAGELALDGNAAAVERQLHRVGLINQASVRSVITEGIPPPLAPSTIAGRIRRVKGGKRRAGIDAALASGVAASRQLGAEGVFTPLIITGEFLKSNTYVLRKVGNKS